MGQPKTRAYHKFLFDEEEEEQMRINIEIAEVAQVYEIVGVSDDMEIRKIAPDIDKLPADASYGAQYLVMEAMYHTAIKLMELPEIELGTSGSYHCFGIVISQDGNVQDCIDSPKLSRKKLIGANPIEVADAVIELLLDRDKWVELSGVRGPSIVLSDGNGNWLF